VSESLRIDCYLWLPWIAQFSRSVDLHFSHFRTRQLVSAANAAFQQVLISCAWQQSPTTFED